MPSTSEKQKRFMQAAAHNKKFAQKVDISQSVAQDFITADKQKAKESKKCHKND